MPSLRVICSFSASTSRKNVLAEFGVRVEEPAQKVFALGQRHALERGDQTVRRRPSVLRSLSERGRPERRSRSSSGKSEMTT